MKLSYRLATISYCPDLTDSNATSVPIAVLALGRDDGRWSAAAVALDAKRLGLEPLSSAMLADVPHLIRRHVDAAVRRLEPNVEPDAVLRAFHEALNTSIHVSAISESRELELRDPRGIAVGLFDRAGEVLEAALRQLLTHVAGTVPRSTWSPRVDPERLMEPAPEQLFWQPVQPDIQAVG